MQVTPRIQTAIDYMQAAHRSIGQTRKDGIRPYEIHPMGVTLRTARYVQNYPWREEILIAALLHDVVEDVPKYSLADIANNFGLVVHGYVDDLTDKYTKEQQPTLNRKTRKQLERERYATMRGGAILVKLCDIAENTTDATDDVGFMRMYLKEKALCLPYLAAANVRDEKLRPIVAQAWADTLAILDEQKKKFGVR